MGPDTQVDAEAGSFCLAKQTRAKTAGVAETRRARETGKPGPTVRHRGKAAWPHARQASGLCSTAKRAAEQGRPSGTSGYFWRLLIEHSRCILNSVQLGLARCEKQVGAADENQPSEPDPGPLDLGLPSFLEFHGLLNQLRAFRLLP